jgi:cell pole-organizing protein PopZ
MQSIVTLRSDVDSAKASTKAKLALEAANMPALRTLMAAYVSYLKVTYGGSPDVLADFGIQQKRRATSTVDVKAGAVAKRKATRAARHTMGTQQKKGVKGDVTGVVVTPITAAPSTVPAPGSPTPPATSGGGPAAPTSPAPSGGTPVSTARMP